ncbi:hypothetical protein BYT27DRAFT_7106544, partial [Phlegmacium glaucopus]
ISGHAGRWKTLESRFISRYVSTCDLCLVEPCCLAGLCWTLGSPADSSKIPVKVQS